MKQVIKYNGETYHKDNEKQCWRLRYPGDEGYGCAIDSHNWERFTKNPHLTDEDLDDYKRQMRVKKLKRLL